MGEDVVRWTRLTTPVGPLLLAATTTGLRRISFEAGRRTVGVEDGWHEDAAALREPIDQLRAWFAGSLRRFELALDVDGTPFQRAVWASVGGIPYGETSSYADIALLAKSPRASRAVGAANGANPLPVVVPCHRVIGADGSLTGFAGGVETKRWLLAHEARHAGPTGRRLRFASDQLALF